MKLRLVLALTLGLAAGCDAAAVTGDEVVTGDEAVHCAAGSIRAQGSSAQANAVNAWIKDYQINCSGATVEYDSSGSGAGVRAFIAGAADFAGTDSPLSAADQAAADARCGTGSAVHLPAVAGPIALAYNVAGVGGLRLAPATVAKVFAGAVTTWDDPAIAADNPGAVLPSTAIRTVHRGDGSGTTANFTAFLAATAGGDWTFGAGSGWPAPGGGAQRGSNGVATAVARTDGAIGYVEASYARFHNLSTALVGNGAGEFVAPADDATARTIAGAEVLGRDRDVRLAVDHRTAVAGAYPIVQVTYEVVCEAGAKELARSFLGYAASPAGQARAARAGYTPLPEELRQKVAAAVSGLR